MGDIRAIDLTEGQVFAEYGMDDEHFIKAVKHRGETVLVTCRGGCEITLDDDEVVEAMDEGQFTCPDDTPIPTPASVVQLYAIARANDGEIIWAGVVDADKAQEVAVTAAVNNGMVNLLCGEDLGKHLLRGSGDEPEPYDPHGNDKHRYYEEN